MQQGAPGSSRYPRGGRLINGYLYLVLVALLLAVLALFAVVSSGNPGATRHIEAPAPFASQQIIGQPSPRAQPSPAP